MINTYSCNLTIAKLCICIVLPVFLFHNNTIAITCNCFLIFAIVFDPATFMLFWVICSLLLI